MRPVALATEDLLSEAVGRRLIMETPGGCVGQTLRRQGFGYLKSSLPKFCEVARRVPVVVLTDLDTAPCPIALLRDWMPAAGLPDGLSLRVAVREVESWLLADSTNLARMLHVAPSLLPGRPDEESDPKAVLLRVASRAPKSLRQELVRIEQRRDGRKILQGIGYNQRLAEFVATQWNPEAAAARSPSLARARLGIAALIGAS